MRSRSTAFVDDQRTGDVCVHGTAAALETLDVFPPEAESTERQSLLQIVPAAAPAPCPKTRRHEKRPFGVHGLMSRFGTWLRQPIRIRIVLSR
jgi:hypothetical protein